MRSLGNWIAFFLQAASLGASPAAFAWDWDGAAWADYGDYLGPIDAGMKAFLQEVAADGVASGRIEGRMGQIGDSITESSAHFRNAILNNITSNQTGHNYDSIRSWIAYSGDQPADANSFYRDHGKGIPYANKSGWKISSAVAAGHPQVAVETGDGVTPGEFAWAILMFGTNDIDPANWDVASWKEEYCAFVQDFIDLGVIPVLSTLPPEQAHAGDGRVQIANDAILDLAGEMNVPWIDYYGLILHFQPVNWHGTLISADGTHPSADSGGQGFSQLAQTSTDGYALRSKLSFDAAEKLRAIVFNDGPPDGATSVNESAPLSPALQAWPNPSPGAMFIRYRVDREATARLRIFDAAGRLVQTWDQGQQFAGSHEVSWDGRDRGGLRVSSGSYLMTLEYGTRHETARIVILR